MNAVCHSFSTKRPTPKSIYSTFPWARLSLFFPTVNLSETGDERVASYACIRVVFAGLTIVPLSKRVHTFGLYLLNMFDVKIENMVKYHALNGEWGVNILLTGWMKRASLPVDVVNVHIMIVLSKMLCILVVTRLHTNSLHVSKQLLFSHRMCVCVSVHIHFSCEYIHIVYIIYIYFWRHTFIWKREIVQTNNYAVQNRTDKIDVVNWIGVELNWIACKFDVSIRSCICLHIITTVAVAAASIHTWNGGSFQQKRKILSLNKMVSFE